MVSGTNEEGHLLYLRESQPKEDGMSTWKAGRSPWQCKSLTTTYSYRSARLVCLAVAFAEALLCVGKQSSRQIRQRFPTRNLIRSEVDVKMPVLSTLEVALTTTRAVIKIVPRLFLFEWVVSSRSLDLYYWYAIESYA